MKKTLTEEIELIKQIVEESCEFTGYHEYKQFAMMAVKSCHLGICPLRLDEMAKADAFNKAHDVFNILRHYNLNTHKFENCFWPRFAAPQ